MAQDRGGRMRGGYGGEGYSNYGRDHGRGSQGGGAEGPPFGDYGSLPSGTERRYGSEGEENYDRGYGRPDDGRNIGEGYRRGRDYAAGPGHVAFGYRPRPGDISHRGRGPRNYVRSDERIRDDVNDRLTHDRWVDATDVEVAVKRGEVTLTGSVDGRLARRRAEDIADAVLGVTHVQNNLRVHDAGGEGGGATSRRAGQAPGGSAQASPTRAPRARSVARRSAAADAAASGNPGVGGSAAGAAGTPAGGRTTSPMPRRTGRSTAGRARLIPDRDDGEGGGAPPR